MNTCLLFPRKPGNIANMDFDPVLYLPRVHERHFDSKAPIVPFGHRWTTGGTTQARFQPVSILTMTWARTSGRVHKKSTRRRLIHFRGTMESKTLPQSQPSWRALHLCRPRSWKTCEIDREIHLLPSKVHTVLRLSRASWQPQDGFSQCGWVVRNWRFSILNRVNRSCKFSWMWSTWVLRSRDSENLDNYSEEGMWYVRSHSVVDGDDTDGPKPWPVSPAERPLANCLSKLQNFRNSSLLAYLHFRSNNVKLTRFRHRSRAILRSTSDFWPTKMSFGPF